MPKRKEYREIETIVLRYKLRAQTRARLQPNKLPNFWKAKSTKNYIYTYIEKYPIWAAVRQLRVHLMRPTKYTRRYKNIAREWTTNISHSHRIKKNLSDAAAATTATISKYYTRTSVLVHRSSKHTYPTKLYIHICICDDAENSNAATTKTTLTTTTATSLLADEAAVHM